MLSNDDHDREAYVIDAPSTSLVTQEKLGENLPPAQYNILQELVSAYEKNAKENGYAVTLGYEDKRLKMKKVVYTCDKGGKPRDCKNKDLHESPT
ncbi:hypothetical protein K3495_g14065 [Podosphaera aphanis]|nr:hypothetical protein K3495_g14065 [Podosphaera aphanis]